MRNRFQAVIALLAIALQALDAVVGSLGHSHPAAEIAAADSHDCCHHDHDAPQPGSPHRDDEHDDCSLCRHFSQSVAPVSLVAPALTNDRVEAFVPTIVSSIDVVFTSTHLARGPPALCA